MGLRFRVQDLGFRFKDLGFRFQDLGFRVTQRGLLPAKRGSKNALVSTPCPARIKGSGKVLSLGVETSGLRI
jgi:hypothetical protein